MGVVSCKHAVVIDMTSGSGRGKAFWVLIIYLVLEFSVPLGCDAKPLLTLFMCNFLGTARSGSKVN